MHAFHEISKSNANRKYWKIPHLSRLIEADIGPPKKDRKQSIKNKNLYFSCNQRKCSQNGVDENLKT